MFRNVVYAANMRRLQILMDEELDDALKRLSAKERKSKSALIRELVRTRVKPLPALENDPIWKMVGVDAYPPVAAEDIDEVVYGHVVRAMEEFKRSRRKPAKRRTRA